MCPLRRSGALTARHYLCEDQLRSARGNRHRTRTDEHEAYSWVPSAEQLDAANVVRLARTLGLRRLPRAPPCVRRGARPLLARGASTISASRSRATGIDVARRLARHRVDDVVRRSAAQPRRGMRAPVGARARRRRGGRLAGGGRNAHVALMGRALSRDYAARRGATRARGPRGRRRRDLPPHVARGRHRLARVRAHRRDPGPDLLRIRRLRRSPRDSRTQARRS